MSRDPKKIMTNKSSKVKASLHKFIATGGKPKDFEGCQGVTSTTVPGYKKSKKYMK